MSKKSFERSFVEDLRAIDKFKVEATYNDEKQPTPQGLMSAVKVDDKLYKFIESISDLEKVEGNDLLHRVTMATFWKDCGRPVFKITPELAAALIMSDLPKEIDTPPPFPAFILSIRVKPDQPTPLVIRGDDYFGFSLLQLEGCWCLWAMPRDTDRDCHYEKMPQGKDFLDWAKEHPPSVHFHRLVANFIAYVSAKRAAGDLPPTQRVKRGARKGQRVCALGKAVQLPHNLIYAARGESGSDPQYKLLKRHVVRGHWRNQNVGCRGGGKTKSIWIMPFWKGPDVLEATERVYEVRER